MQWKRVTHWILHFASASMLPPSMHCLVLYPPMPRWRLLTNTGVSKSCAILLCRLNRNLRRPSTPTAQSHRSSTQRQTGVSNRKTFKRGPLILPALQLALKGKPLVLPRMIWEAFLKHRTGGFLVYSFSLLFSRWLSCWGGCSGLPVSWISLPKTQKIRRLIRPRNRQAMKRRQRLAEFRMPTKGGFPFLRPVMLHHWIWPMAFQPSFWAPAAIHSWS